MKQIETFRWRCLQYLLMLIIFLVVLPGLSGCKKILGIEELKLTGRITDDITGGPISGGGSIKIDGYNPNGGIFVPDRKSNLGTGKINRDGSFAVSFSKWEYAATYEIYFHYSNLAYINNGNIYLNTLLLDSTVFANGSYNTNITAAKLTELQINFQNQNPFNADDSLHISFPDNNVHFYYLFPKWENLQNCSVGLWRGIKGGINASGTLKCNVPCDRKFKLKWLTRKNAIINNFSDSLFCPRNMTTIYSLNY